jgi:hypothetical protein
MANQVPERFRTPLLIASGLVLSGLMLWGIWFIEEATAPVRTTVVESEEGEEVFSVTVERRQGGDYIVYCDEELFQEAFRKFAKHVDVETEPLPVPGGPMLLAMADVDLPEALAPAQRTAIEVLKRHSPRRVVLVAHAECLLYDSLSAWQNDLDNVRERQLAHLIAAREALRTWLPETEVEIYHADKEGERLEFRRVPEDEVELTRIRELGGEVILIEDGSEASE